MTAASAEAGTALPVKRIASVSAPAMHRMAVILADPNLIHLDPAAVAAAGLGDRVINQGPTNVGYMIDTLREAFPEGTIIGFDARFVANVFGGDAVTIAGTVSEVIPTAGGVNAVCDMTLTADPDRLALTARAIVRLPIV